jgi:hypothetical protein
VQEFVGVSVHECCERAQRPRCCFEIGTGAKSERRQVQVSREPKAAPKAGFKTVRRPRA